MLTPLREWVAKKLVRAALAVMGVREGEPVDGRRVGGSLLDDDGDYDEAAYPAVTLGERALDMLAAGKQAPRKTGTVPEPPLRGSLAERRLRAARR